MPYRDPTPTEYRLLRSLAIAAPELVGGADWVSYVRVESMNDGGMGSLRLALPSDTTPTQPGCKIAAELIFTDADGVAVIASLYTNAADIPIELDMWKVSFAPLIRVPDPLPRTSNKPTEFKLNATEEFKRIAARFPEADPEVSETFPSGAVMLDLTIGGVRYCAAYLPSHKTYGLSKTDDGSPFWEGVEHSFTSAEQLEAKILEMMNATK